MLLGTRFTNAISCFNIGPQEPYRDILETPCGYQQFLFSLCEIIRDFIQDLSFLSPFSSLQSE
jgi:hypothetical protein